MSDATKQGLLRERGCQVTVWPDDRQIARVLAAQWGVTIAEAVGLALAGAYRQEFGRDPKGAS
jgi:hypothetical protein